MTNNGGSARGIRMDSAPNALTEATFAGAAGHDQYGVDLDAVCASTLRLLNAIPGQLLRLRVSLGSAEIDAQWPSAGTSPAAGQVPAAEADRTATPPVPTGEQPGLVIVRAPMVGVFYRAAEPGARPFVAVGEQIEPGQQIGILEAMKLMNPIEADATGEVVDILVEDGTPVEYDQPLLAVREGR